MKTILATILTVFLLAGVARAEQVYLYVMFHDDNTQGERFRTKMQDMEQCLKVLEASKITTPDHPSGDYEVMSGAWCGGDMERNYNATWWKDEEKDLGE